MVHEYGGTFLFEHPWTSKAWQDHRLRTLLEDPNIFLTKNDQCQFDLKSMEGDYHKKPTGWLCNNKVLASALHKECPGDHPHRPILGSSHGIQRSAYAARYPTALVDHILQAYKASTSYTEELYVSHTNDLFKESYQVDRIMEIMAGEEMESEEGSKASPTEPLPVRDLGDDGLPAEDLSNERPLPLERPGT